MGHDGPVRNGLVIGLERDLYGFRSYSVRSVML
jgi:hypothetical protein